MSLVRDLPRVSCHLRSYLLAPLVIAMEGKDFFAKPKCEPATSHTCGVVEAIFLQATLVLGLLRYARNDKKQDGHEAKASRDDNLLLADKGHFKKTF